MGYEANRPVKTTIKTFEIIKHLCETDRIRLSDLAEELETNKGIVHNHLSTLRELGYVRKVGKDYQLSPKFLNIGFKARSHSRLFNASHIPISNFAKSNNIGVLLSEQVMEECIITDKHCLPKKININIGTKIPISNSLIGLVASNFDSTEMPHNSGSEYDLTKIRKAINEQGYVIGPIMSSVSIRCAVVSIADSENNCNGSIAFFLPSHISNQESDEFFETVLRLRSRIENRLNSGWESTRSYATLKNSWFS